MVDSPLVEGERRAPHQFFEREFEMSTFTKLAPKLARGLKMVLVPLALAGLAA